MKKILEAIKENKAYIFPWVILVALTVIMAFGLTYAYFDFIVDSDSESSMKVLATDLHVNISNPTVNLNDLKPIYDEYKDTQANSFTFTMSNTSRKLSGCVDLYITFNSISDGLKSRYIKWELTNTTTGVTTAGNFSNVSDDRLLLKENENIPISTTYSYTLKIWFSFSTTDNQNNVAGSMNAKITTIAYGGACAATKVTTYTSGTNQFTASVDGYYRIETYNTNGSYASGEVFLAIGEKLYTTVTTASNVRCYIDQSTGLCGTSSGQNDNNSRIMYAGTNITNSFISGYAGMNAPVYTTSSNELSYNTIHPTGKFFLNGDLKFNTDNTDEKIVITYLGKYQERTNTKLNNVRYIKDCINGNSANSDNHWVEIQAIKNGVNIAYKKTSPNINSRIVDGVIASSGWYSGAFSCITIDLGKTYDLDEIAVWHYYADGRTYNDNITSVSSNNSTWTEVINKVEPETALGKRVDAYAEKNNPTITLSTDQGTTGLDIGDLVTISNGTISEQFYVISTNATETTLLAKYNLYVGNVYSDQGTTLVKKLTPSDAGYGLQNSAAKGKNGKAETGAAIGTVPFSKKAYWQNSTNGTIYSEYGTYTNGNNNVYNNKYSNIEDWENNLYSIAYYVEEYTNKLGLNGTGRLLLKSEYDSLKNTYGSIIFNDSSYWMGSSTTNSSGKARPYCVSRAYDALTNVISNFTSTANYGVRPVIVVPTSNIN